jgi:hypothetical protein
LFFEGTFSTEYLVYRVKLLFWKWLLGKNPGIPFSFYECGMHPIFGWNRQSLMGCGTESS